MICFLFDCHCGASILSLNKYLFSFMTIVQQSSCCLFNEKNVNDYSYISLLVFFRWSNNYRSYNERNREEEEKKNDNFVIRACVSSLILSRLFKTDNNVTIIIFYWPRRWQQLSWTLMLPFFHIIIWYFDETRWSPII